MEVKEMVFEDDWSGKQSGEVCNWSVVYVCNGESNCEEKEEYQ